ncbi:MAG: DNA polymerase III subunit gamma/tau [Candidatus Babeliales bacterium]
MNINLARKWRSRTFDELIGQELSVRMLKNSLYLDHYFPVYLFSGQRGCGKTSAARIFAAAVNCSMLQAFQQDPKKNIIPCLACESCMAMMRGKHPDFIEIDAASHTGVDNVRNIIDAAALMPVLGSKKIYLIDEAHMLSKAAFNAFLKILEEPPASVFFILATTDPHKIIDTVTSRCFQLFFKPVLPTMLVKHLATICQKEKIEFELEGLKIIANQTDGSVRDALNLLEQVRFSQTHISPDAVFKVLGFLDTDRLFALLDTVLNKEPADVLHYLQEISFELYTSTSLWDSCVLFFRDSIYLKHGIVNEKIEHANQISSIILSHRPEALSSYLQMFYDHENAFSKTRFGHQILEHVLLKICNIKMPKQNSGIQKKTSNNGIAMEKKTEIVIKQSQQNRSWQNFLMEIQTLEDPLIYSIFKQAQFSAFDQEANIVQLSYPKNFVFFDEILQNTTNTWLSKLQKVFGEQIQLKATFTEAAQSKTSLAIPLQAKENKVPQFNDLPQEKAKQKESLNKVTFQNKKSFIVKKNNQEKKIDISDKNLWKKTHLVLSAFPGLITEVPEDTHA